jgi:hypothetical protein
LPYHLRDDFLWPAERSFYGVLVQAVGGRYAVCSKVNLADLLFVPAAPDAQAHRNRIDRKHADFVLCETATMRPVAAVELDDASHARTDRKERDELVGRACEAAGLPLVRVPARASYSVAAVAEQVLGAVGATPEATVETASAVEMPAEAVMPTCPKCGVAMVRRTASGGPNAGRPFFGCPNFPRCRQTVPISA